MCRFSFINVVCEILKLNCDLCKAKEKKGRGLPRVPGHLALGEGQIKKKGQGLPRVPWHLALGEGKIKKKDTALPRVPGQRTNFFTECCTRGRGSKKKKFLPRVLHSGKSKKKSG
jgi:hypothetical protein